MKELFDKFPKIKLEDAKDLILIDTCFFISVFKHPEHIKQFSKLKNKAMTSFNIKELITVDHKLKKLKHPIRKFLENNEFPIINIDVHPGNRQKEEEFIKTIEPNLLKYCKDPSDGVLLATAIKTKSNILTKDKHHIFNAIMENFANKHNINIYKELKQAISS